MIVEWINEMSIEPMGVVILKRGSIPHYGVRSYCYELLNQFSGIE